MKKLFVLLVVSVFVLFFSSFAEAGDVVGKKSQKITISGEIRLDAIFQDRDSAGVIYDDPTVPGFPPTTHSVTFADPRITLNLDISLATQVNAFLQLRTPVYLRDDFGAPPIELATPETGTPPAHGTAEYPSRILEVKEAYLFIKEFLWREFSMTLGVQSLRYELRGDGDAFFLGIGESESPFPPAGGHFINPANADFELWAPGHAGTTEAGGIKTTYKKKAMMCEISLDTFLATISETRDACADQEILGVVLNLWMPEAKDAKGSISLLATTLTLGGNGHNGRIWTYGGGGTFKCSKDLEIYAEAYGQGGKFCDGFVAGPPDDPPEYDGLSTRSGDIKQLAFAGYGGARYTITATPWRPFLGASYWWVSGDRDNTDLRQQNFISYEDVNDTLIIEDGQYGFDIDTNYQAIKCIAGFKPHKDWEFSVIFGSFSRAREDKPKAGPRNKLGDEIDLAMRWDYTEDTTFRARFGILTDSTYLSEATATGHNRPYTMGQFEAILRF
jgi:hypothetical protein